MPLEDSQVRQLVLDLLKNPSKRDGQRLIGASEIGNPCSYCLAHRLLNKKPGEGRNYYWLGGRLGTAMHAALEEEASRADTTDYRFAALEGARLEESIVLGEIPEYGTIKSKPDLVLVQDSHLLDYKSSTREKVKYYKLDGVPEQYIYQQQLYAWGLNEMGVAVEKISLVFVNRDGKTDDDVWVYSFDYNQKLALHAWSRLEKMWKWLQDGGDPDTLASDPNCYVCSVILRRI